jgi:cytochrome c biogenesis protein
MEKEKKKSLIDRVWDLFASVKLAVVIFSVIALTSMVGTVLEQGAEPEKNIKVLSKLFGESAAPSLYTFFQKLGFMDMYHSWWFVSLLLLFSANLIICSLDRLPRIWKIVKEPIHPLEPDRLEKMSIKRSLTIKTKFSNTKDFIGDSLKRIGFKASEASLDNGFQLYSEKGNYTRLGVYITHCSILVILAGAIIGLFLGFNAYLPLQEGETSSVAFKGKDETVPLGFELRCDNFEVSYYAQSDMPKEYKSWLTVIKDGKEVLQKTIVVNDPLTYEGITFYQSSFGTVQGNGIVILKTVSKDGRASDISAKIGDTFTIPGTSVQGRIANFSPALAFEQSGRPFTYDQNLKNPAIYVELSGLPSGAYSGWILKRYPQTWSLPDGSRIEFLDYWGVEYTGMQVRKDPGVLIVYLGCIMMAIGLYITFFMSHRRIWVHVAEDKGGPRIIIGASANKNRAAFERTIEKFVGMISVGQKGGK